MAAGDRLMEYQRDANRAAGRLTMNLDSMRQRIESGTAGFVVSFVGFASIFRWLRDI
jgi:hypothetical protein